MSSQSISNRPTLAACTNSSIASASDRSTRPPYWIGGGVHGGGSHPGSSHFRGGFVGVYAPYWWGYGFPYFPTSLLQLRLLQRQPRSPVLRLRSWLQLLRQLSRLWLRLAPQRPADLVLLLR